VFVQGRLCKQDAQPKLVFVDAELRKNVNNSLEDVNVINKRHFRELSKPMEILPAYEE
jgi:hypothetical protein